MNDARLGIVRLEWSGQQVPLRFTWAAIDQLGADAIGERMKLALTGEPGARLALAELLNVASAGSITTEAAMAEVGLPGNAFSAIFEAWSLATRRPAGAQPGNPRMNRLSTWWKRLWRQPKHTA